MYVYKTATKMLSKYNNFDVICFRHFKKILLHFALFLYDPDLTTRAKKTATPLFYSNQPKRIYNKSRSLFALNHIESGNFAF